MSNADVKPFTIVAHNAAVAVLELNAATLQEVEKERAIFRSLVAQREAAILARDEELKKLREKITAIDARNAELSELLSKASRARGAVVSFRAARVEEPGVVDEEPLESSPSEPESFGDVGPVTVNDRIGKSR